MLECVRKHHESIIPNLRREDSITGPVLGRLVEDMLGKAEARSSAFTLYERSKDIVLHAKVRLETDKRMMNR